MGLATRAPWVQSRGGQGLEASPPCLQPRVLEPLPHHVPPAPPDSRSRTTYPSPELLSGSTLCPTTVWASLSSSFYTFFIVTQNFSREAFKKITILHPRPTLPPPSPRTLPPSISFSGCRMVHCLTHCAGRRQRLSAAPGTSLAPTMVLET